MFKPMKLSLVKKNILKSTDYKCYCTERKLKHTQDHVTDQNGGKLIPSIYSFFIWSAPNI